MNPAKKLKIILTGATGLVGEGVLIECLQNADVQEVVAINRKPCGMVHPKLREIIHGDFFDITPIANLLEGYDACFFCAGVSSTGMKEPEYYRLTYTMTLNFAETLSKVNPNLTFEYISGLGTDSSEKGRIMWANVKGKTENALLKLPFHQVFMIRPGFMKPTSGQKNVGRSYQYLSWLFPVMRKLMPTYASTLREVGLTMIHVARYGYPKPILEVKDIIALAAQP